MGLLQEELAEVRKLCEHLISGSKLVSCVETMVRVEIKRTTFKAMVVCIQFSLDYPNTPLLLELKSKTLADKLLTGLTNVCEQELKKLLGQSQILKILHFIHNFIMETPLCCCYNEINNLKKLLTSKNDELKLRQKASSIFLKVVSESYYLKAKILVPDNYPEISVGHMLAQAKEYARQCVEPPLRKRKTNEPPFKPLPSLEKVVSFLTDSVKRFPKEKCQFCEEQCFPDEPENLIMDETSSKHVDRLYCGHLFHSTCLIAYMRKPPFGNKRCTVCNQRIYHEKWALADKLAEDRWAHEQARERELAEVTDFFQ
ncbi:uncharacterized protein CBL_01733 [Carabus blaptoides fortunei]